MSFDDQSLPKLRQDLRTLTQRQFEDLLNDLDVPKDEIPPRVASTRAEQVEALLTWAKSPLSPKGIKDIQDWIKSKQAEAQGCETYSSQQPPHRPLPKTPTERDTTEPKVIEVFSYIRQVIEYIFTGSDPQRNWLDWLKRLGPTTVGVGIGLTGLVKIAISTLDFVVLEYHSIFFLEPIFNKWDFNGADRSTLDLMLTVSDRHREGFLDGRSLEKFDCNALNKIDNLWDKKSDGKFSFRAQIRIWQEMGSPTEPSEEWQEFVSRVGWRQSIVNDYRPNPKVAPEGERPFAFLWSHDDFEEAGFIENEMGKSETVTKFSALAQRFLECQSPGN